MRCWPIIARELRAQSRLARSHWLRWIGAIALIAGTYACLVGRLPPSTQWVIQPNGSAVPLAIETRALDRWASAFGQFEKDGTPLLAMMNVLVVASIWLLAPFLTADCLSTERRQGTLGILLLTPMRAIDVVRAKWVVHGWQAAWLFLAGLPVLMIPFLAGGVGWVDGVYVTLIDASILVMALTAGMVASSLWNGPRAVLIGAAALSLVLAGVLSVAWAVGVGLGGMMAIGVAAVELASFQSEVAATWVQGIGILRDSRHAWFAFQRTPGPLRLLEGVAGLVATLFSSALLLRFVAHRVTASVRDGDVIGKSSAVAKESMPREGVSVWRNRMLEMIRRRNPFLWVELRTWRGHVVPGLCVGILFPWEIGRSLAGVSLSPSGMIGAPVWVFAGILALAATSCLSEERASGSLEFLLTVPRGARRLARGKFTGLALQALPALILVLSIEISLLRGISWDPVPWWVSAGEFLFVALGLAGRLALALTAGAYLGLRIRNLVVACLATILTLGIAAFFGRKLALWVTGAEDFSLGVGTVGVGGAVELVLALGCAWATYRVLDRRQPELL